MEMISIHPDCQYTTAHYKCTANTTLSPTKLAIFRPLTYQKHANELITLWNMNIEKINLEGLIITFKIKKI
jgi:hypothetical protein